MLVPMSCVMIVKKVQKVNGERAGVKEGGLANIAACEHDAFSLVMMEDHSYYTKHWRDKHRGSQVLRSSSLLCLPLKCSGCGGEIEDQ